jgi:hypothetical protein
MKKEISYNSYVKETNKYYIKAFRDFMIIVFLIALTFLIR